MSSFFEYAFQTRLHSFVEYELTRGRDVETLFAGFSLLFAAVLEGDIKLIRLLFDHGANANFCGGKAPKSTPWKVVLRRVLQLRDLPTSAMSANRFNAVLDVEVAADIVSAFLEHNADPHLSLDHKSIRVIIKEGFEDWNTERTIDLLRKLDVLKKSYRDSSRSLSGIRNAFKKLGRKNLKAG
jgi:hypothetical protein